MLPPSDIQHVVSAIYRTEGGTNSNYPFGIKIANQHFNFNQSSNICYRTVEHFISKHKIAKIDKYFITLLSNTYCPPSCDLVGNKNWRHNMIRILHL